MRYEQDICMAAKALLGAEEPRLQIVLPAVEQMLSASLRWGVTPSDCEESFICAAALLAVSLLRQIRSQGINQFDAGTLNISFDTGDSLGALAKQLMEPWLETGSAFRGVRG